MKPQLDHPWTLSETEARLLQMELSAKVIKEDKLSAPGVISGVDVAYKKDGPMVVAAVVSLDACTLTEVERITVAHQVDFPYVPGLFSFREIPAIIEAFAYLKHNPDLVVCDAHGYAHPRRFGLACHLGVLFDLPTIGCAKTRLIGQHGEPRRTRGATTPLTENREIIGSVLRTQDRTKPVYISIGNRISLPTACKWILRLTPKYRLPETTRKADQAVRSAIKRL